MKHSKKITRNIPYAVFDTFEEMTDRPAVLFVLLFVYDDVRFVVELEYSGEIRLLTTYGCNIL